MDDRRKTIAALTIIIGFVVLVIVIIGLVISGRSVVSPVPDEGAIKVIFLSPTAVMPAPSETTAPPDTVKATPKPSPKASATPKPSATPTATSTPKLTPTP